MQLLPLMAARLRKSPLSSLVAVAGILVAIMGAVYSAQSLVLALSLSRALPRADQWAFVEDYYRYLDGGYSFIDLFKPQAEYRPLTIRLVLFPDAIMFRMRGILPVLTSYAALGGIAYLAARAAVGRDARQIWAGFAILLGLTWSTVQFENLSWPFQVGVPLAHFFALLCYWALALSLTEPSPRRWTLLALAIGADFFAVFSQGLGPLSILPAIAIAVWLRALNRNFLIFLLAHLVISAPFFVDLVFADFSKLEELLAKSPATERGPWDVADFVIGFLSLAVTNISGLIGLSFTNFTGAAPIDKLTFVAFVALAIAATWISTLDKKKVDLELCVLLGVCSFVVLEAIAVSFGRAVMAARYATPSAIFIACLLSAGWRLTTIFGKEFVQPALLGLAAAALLAMNAPAYEREWRYLTRCIDEATESLRAGPPERLPCIVEQLVYLPRAELTHRFVQSRLGPFARD